MIQNAVVRSCGNTRALVGVLLFGFLLNTFAIGWGIPNVRSWNPDDIAPIKPIKVVQTYTHGSDKYPLLQSWIDFLVFAPFLLYWKALKTFDSVCTAIVEVCFGYPYGQLSVLLIVSRLIAALMAAGAVYWTYRISLFVFQDPLAALLAALALTVSNVFVFSAHVGTVDVPYLFWFTWSIYYYLCIVETSETRHYICFGFLSACALATIEAVVGAYVLPGLIIYFTHIRDVLKKMQTAWISSFVRTHAHVRFVGLIVALFLTYGIINNVFFNWDGYVKHFTHWVGSNAPGVAPYSRRELGPVWLLKKFVVDLGAGMGRPLLLFCMAGSVYVLIRNWKKAVLLIIPAISYYIFSIHSVHYSLPRFGLPVVVLLALFGGALAAQLCRASTPWIWLYFPIIILVFLHGLLKSANMVMVMHNDSRYHAEQWLNDHVPKTTTIAVFSIPTYLPRFELNGYNVESIAGETLPINYLQKKGFAYVVLSSKFDRGARLKQEEFLTALNQGKLNYVEAWDYRYESPLTPIIGDRYISTFINPRITIFKRTVSAP